MASTAIPLPVSASQGEVPFFIRVMGFILRIPLVFKILGANAIIAGVVLVLLGSGPHASEEGAIVVVIIALTLAFAVNALLVRVALTPIEELQNVGYNGYLTSEYCLPAYKKHHYSGIEEIDHATKISLQYMKQLVHNSIMA